MENFELKGTQRTPRILFDFGGGELSISGESYPEDASTFFRQVFDALRAYLAELGDGGCRFVFDLIYFNSSSAKAIMMIMEKLDTAAAAGASVDIHWRYDPEDDTMQELGEDFGEDLKHAAFHLEEATR